jgi:hypothetical protein
VRQVETLGQAFMIGCGFVGVGILLTMIVSITPTAAKERENSQHSMHSAHAGPSEMR